MAAALAGCGGDGGSDANAVATVTVSPTKETPRESSEPTETVAEVEYAESDECVRAVTAWLRRGYAPLADPLLEGDIRPVDLTRASERVGKLNDPVLDECSPKVGLPASKANLNLSLASLPFDLSPPALEVGNKEFDLTVKAMMQANRARNLATSDRR